MDHTGLLYVIGFGFAATTFVFGTILFSWLVTHRRRRPQKGLPYECGIDTIGDTWSRFGLAFYLYALLFGLGFGARGPYAERPSYDSVAQALGKLAEKGRLANPQAILDNLMADGKVIPMDAHIRLANPRTPESQSNLMLRRGYSYSLGVSNAGQLEMGLLFVCYQADLEKGFLTVQKRLNGEALIVDRQIARQELIRRVQRRDVGEPHLLGHPILKGFKEPLHPPLGLGGVGRDQLDSQLAQRPPKLTRGHDPGQLLVHRGWGRRLIGRMFVRVDGQRNPIPSHVAREAVQRRERPFIRVEPGKHSAARIVDVRHQHTTRPAPLEPVMVRTIYLHHLTTVCFAWPPPPVMTSLLSFLPVSRFNQP